MSKVFAFIHTDPGIDQDAQKDVKFAARSHTAKVNRRRQALSRRRTISSALCRQPTQSAALLTPTGLGAGDCITPDLSSPAVADVIDFVFRSVLTQAFTPSEIGRWFQGFCEMPLLYYAWSHHRFFIESRMSASLPECSSNRLLTTRTSAHQLLQSFLSVPEHDQSRLERVLLAMAITSQHEPDSAVVDDLPLCRPHMLYAEGFDVFRVRQLKGFLPAAVSLVNRLPGGLDSLVDTGLFRILCMLDLISAAVDFTPPFFPCGWQHPFEVGTTINEEERPGHGFLRLPVGALPRSAIFVELCHLDRFMAQYKDLHLSPTDFQDLLAWRNAVVHELLSLPARDQLSDEEKETSFAELYDCCRLTAIIYTNAIICATPAGCKGFLEPLRLLTALLKDCDSGVWGYEMSMVLLWSMFAGGIAAYGTIYWGAFVQAVRDLIRVHEITSLDDVKLVLRRFLWSDHACESGATILWAAVVGHDYDDG